MESFHVHHGVKHVNPNTTRDKTANDHQDHITLVTTGNVQKKFVTMRLVVGCVERVTGHTTLGKLITLNKVRWTLP